MLLSWMRLFCSIILLLFLLPEGFLYIAVRLGSARRIGSARSLQAEPFTLPHAFADAGSTLPYEIVETPSFNQT